VAISELQELPTSLQWSELIPEAQIPEAAHGLTKSTVERGDACPNLRIGDTCVDLFVEPVNRLGFTSVHRWDDRIVQKSRLLRTAKMTLE
jgi:hypothetical protein